MTIELSELVKESLNIFEINDINLLSDKLREITIQNKYEYYKKFKEYVKKLDVDWLQKIYQYYGADRKNLKQDYTPKSLAQLISKITNINEDECIDMCCGSGALLIQKWITNKNIKFICEEYDENVIPILLFNLSVRNTNATVKQIDVLSGEVFKKYKVKSQEEFSKIEVEE